MARNRKRAKDRRSGRPTEASARPGLATAHRERPEDAPDRAQPAARPDDTMPGAREPATPNEPGDTRPGALEHATPDVELAEAQVARGRPDLAEEAQGKGLESMLEDEGDEDLGPQSRAGDRGGDAGDNGPPRGTDIEPAGPGAPHPEARARAGSRLITFIQGSWRELQRVQWPDRRQVMQATGVVIGFVIVAGAFLGLADLVAGKVVTFILK